MKIALTAVVMFSLAVGTPSLLHAADSKQPAKKEEKKPDKPVPPPAPPAPPASTPDKKKDSSGNTSDAFKVRGNPGT